MHRPARPSAWLLAASFTMNVGCGQIDLPVIFALQGEENTITIEVPTFPPQFRFFSTDLVGGANATVTIDLNPFELFTPNGLAALISIDQIHMAGTDIDILGVHTGTLCIFDDIENPGGGIAYIRPLHQEADFNLSFNTLISGPDLVTLFGPDPLPFQAEIATTVPVTLTQLIGLLVGGGAGGLELSQSIETTLPDDIPFLGGGTLTADLTLATVETFPTDEKLDECADFLGF
jgi:hypothetical protein